MEEIVRVDSQDHSQFACHSYHSYSLIIVTCCHSSSVVVTSVVITVIIDRNSIIDRTGWSRSVLTRCHRHQAQSHHFTLLVVKSLIIMSLSHSSSLVVPFCHTSLFDTCRHSSHVVTHNSSSLIRRPLLTCRDFSYSSHVVTCLRWSSLVTSHHSVTLRHSSSLVTCHQSSLVITPRTSILHQSSLVFTLRHSLSIVVTLRHLSLVITLSIVVTIRWTLG